MNKRNQANESTTNGDVAAARPTRLGTYLRNKPVSGSLLQEDWQEIADFLINIETVLQDLEWQEDFDRILGDIEYLGRTTTLSEGVLFSKKISSSKAAAARRWYQKNKGHLAARRRKLKSSISAKAKAKKRERLRKQRKKLNKKPIRKYPSAKNHNEENNLNV